MYRNYKHVKFLARRIGFSFFAERTLSKLKINRVNNEIITYPPVLKLKCRNYTLLVIVVSC